MINFNKFSENRHEINVIVGCSLLNSPFIIKVLVTQQEVRYFFFYGICQNLAVFLLENILSEIYFTSRSFQYSSTAS
jgi:hypothetical protein